MRIVIGILIILLLVGCTDRAALEQAEQDAEEAERMANDALEQAREMGEMPDVDEEPIDDTSQDDTQETEGSSEGTDISDDDAVDMEDDTSATANETVEEGCQSTASPQELDRIEMSTTEELFQYISRDSEGFTFRFFPMTKDGEIMPVEGNLAVTVHATEDDPSGGRRITEPVYSRSYYIKPENVMDDCSPQPITIKFEDIKKDSFYKYVEDDDLGVLTLTFKRIGSGSLYEYEIKGYEHDFSFMP